MTPKKSNSESLESRSSSSTCCSTWRAKRHGNGAVRYSTIPRGARPWVSDRDHQQCSSSATVAANPRITLSATSSRKRLPHHSEHANLARHEGNHSGPLERLTWVLKQRGIWCLPGRIRRWSQDRARMAEEGFPVFAPMTSPFLTLHLR
eukprot:1152148-Pelagomonas_calceolata.AAC.2